MDVWIDITEYATKYGVSASTLRRRIRGNSINFKMEKGKYLLQDTAQALSAAPLFSRVRATNIRQNVVSSNQVPIHRAQTANLHDPVAELLASGQISSDTISTAEYNRVVNENRKLKAQIEELETLVKALEAEQGSNA
jgi:hypothetical protein